MIPDLAIQSCLSTILLFPMRGPLDLRYLDAVQYSRLCRISASVPATSPSSFRTTPLHVQYQLPTPSSYINYTHPKVQP